MTYDERVVRFNQLSIRRDELSEDEQRELAELEEYFSQATSKRADLDLTEDGVIDSAGREHRLYRPDEPLAERCSLGLPEIGRVIQSQWRGELSSVASEVRELRALGGNVDAAGGIAVPGAIAAQILDAVRVQMVLTRAGIRTLPMESRNVTIAAIGSDVSTATKPENASMATSDMTFEALTLEAYNVYAGMEKVSQELVEDIVNPEIIPQAIAAALATEIDNLGLNGSGAGQPRGLRMNANINTVNHNGAFSLDGILNCVSEIVKQNFTDDNLTCLLSASDWVSLQSVTDGDGAYMFAKNCPEVFSRMKFLATSSLLHTYGNTVRSAAGAGTDSELHVGKFEHMCMGVRRAMQIQTTKEGAAMQAGQVWLAANIRCDFQQLRPKAFCTLYNIS